MSAKTKSPEPPRSPEPPPLAAEVARYLAELRERPERKSAVDANGRLLPITDEELRARAEELARALEEIDRTAGPSDSPEVWREVMRSIDESRPHRPLFEGMY